MVEFDNGVTIVVPVVEDNADVSFISNINLVGTNINNSNDGTLVENDVEKGLQVQYKVELICIR